MEFGAQKSFFYHKPLCSINRSTILTAVKNGVKNMQAAAYNGAYGIWFYFRILIKIKHLKSIKWNCTGILALNYFWFLRKVLLSDFSTLKFSVDFFLDFSKNRTSGAHEMRGPGKYSKNMYTNWPHCVRWDWTAMLWSIAVGLLE